jgi:hypothetical protein
MASLKDLKEILEKLDPNKILEGKAYELTYNEHLGLKDSSDFTNFFVGLPYNPWPANVSTAPKSFESTLAIAFKEVFTAGLPKTAAKGEKVYIDIAHLWGHWVEFFNRRGDNVDGGEDNLAHWIGKKLLDIPADAIPVIRILIGSSENLSQTQAWDILKGDIEKLFWPPNKKCEDFLKTLT